MKTKRFLSLVVALCMVLAFVPAMASAAEEQVLFDVADLTISGEQGIDQGGWTATESGAAVKWNQNWGDNGTWGSQGTYALMFFFTNQRGKGDGNAEATINNAADTKGAEKISIDFNFACQEVSDLYQRWNFKDNDGKTFATFYFDKNVAAEVGNPAVKIANTGAEVLAMRGQAMNITATKNAEGKFDVVYTVNGNVVTTDTVESINGFKSVNAEVYSWNQQYAAAGLQNLKITYAVPETMKEVTATYTVNGETVATANGMYDTASEEGAAFAEKNYSLDGSSVLYHADAAVLAENTTIEMTPAVNNGPYAVGDAITSAGKLYKVKGENLIPNGDFAYGLAGWFNGQDAASTATVNGDGTVTLKDGGTNSAAALYRSWPIEAGKTYVFTYTNGSSNEYHVMALTNALGASNNNENSGVILVGSQNGGTLAASDEVGTNNFAFTNDAGYAYARIQYRWAGNNVVGNFGLYEVEEDAEAKDATVVYKKADGTVIKTVSEQTKTSITVPEKEIFLTDGGYYTLPEATAAAGETNEITVENTPNKYAVIEDALVSDNEIWGIKKTNDNSVFVAAGADVNRAPLNDANGTPLRGSNDPSTLGKSRVGFVEFPVVDLAEGQKAVAHFYVRTWHDNGFSNGNDSLRVAAFVVNDSSWTALSDGNSYDSANAPILATYPNAIFSDVNYRTEELTFDVTDAMKAANAAGLEKFDLRLNSAWGAAYIAEREAAVEGGKYEGKAAYIAVEDANAVVVTATGAELSKNGSNVGTSATFTAEDDVRLISDAAVVLAGGKLYIPKETKVAAEAADLEATALTFGIEMKGGQVRVGKGVTAENKVGENSGIRFVAVVDRENTIANEAAEIGVTLTAAGSDKSVDVPTTKFQDETDTVFTVAVTNLAESNYNRNYTAVPYAKVTLADGTEKTFTGNGATRSAYAVSAGLLKNGAVDLVEGDTYVVDEAVASVLNAYVNQTGVRIVIENGTAAVASTYTGDVFFDVTSVQNGNSYEITITPDASFVTPVTISDWWKDYVRVNNNNSTAKGFISNEKIENGVLTFTFTPAA